MPEQEQEPIYAIYRFVSKQELGTPGVMEVTRDFVRSYASPVVAMGHALTIKHNSDPDYVWIRVKNLATGEWIEVN